MKGIKIYWDNIKAFLIILFNAWKNRKGGGKMKLVALIGALMLVGSLAFGQEIVLKQGFVGTWERGQFKNITLVKVLETVPIEGWGRWNALWAGWSLEPGWAYSAENLTSVALMVGRRVGTLADWLPGIQNDLLNKVDITIYPVGMYVESMFDHPQFQGASGGALIQLNMKF